MFLLSKLRLISDIELHHFKIASMSSVDFIQEVETHCSLRLSMDISLSQGFIKLLSGQLQENPGQAIEIHII